MIENLVQRRVVYGIIRYEKKTISDYDVVNADNELEIFDNIFNIDFQKQCDETLNVLLNFQNEHGDLFKQFQNRRLDDLKELVFGDDNV